MTPDLSDIWEQIEKSNPVGEKLIARQFIPTISNRILYAIDFEKKRHFLILLEPGESGIEDRNSRGLVVITRDLQVHGKEPGRYLDIECRDPAGYPAFNLIGYEIAVELAKAKQQPSDIVRRVLSRWRRFWGQIPREMLSREKIVGLLAELWFLSHWMIPSVGPIEAVRRWRGPFGARHDFEWPGRSIEVKASSSSRGRIHHIHGLEQLEPPEAGDLLLYSVLIREEGGALATLPSLIIECKNLLENDADAIIEFETALVRNGYSPAHEDEYNKLSFRISHEALFKVTNNFPRLLNSSIIGGLPAGIEHVEYEINLNGNEDLIIARSISEIDMRNP